MIAKESAEGYKEVITGILLKNLVHGEKTHVVEVKLKKGAVLPEHHHVHEQTGYLISGSLKFVVDGGCTVVNPGDSWNFASESLHGAEALEDSVAVEVFSPIREDYLIL